MEKEKEKNNIVKGGKGISYLKYTEAFWDVLSTIYTHSKDSTLVEELFSYEGSSNPWDIVQLDVSPDDWHFRISYEDGDVDDVKCGKFIREIFPDTFVPAQVREFIELYNVHKPGGVSRNLWRGLGRPNFGNHNDYRNPKIDLKNRIIVDDFSYKPLDVRHTFLTLVTETYPHPHEAEVLKYLPKELKKDEFGNYYAIIGKSESLFTCHLDTADRNKTKGIVLLSKKEGNDEIIYTDGSTILGADDKSGVVCLMYMMAHNIPGVYYFFIGEERGGIGSSRVANRFNTIPYLKGIKRCISFDRRNNFSIITSQMGGTCCSDDFATQLCKELNKSGHRMGLDPGGIFTDSANFIDYIPECTNVSVGYMNEHTGRELQNISFLDRLCKALVKVNWEELPTTRKIGIDTDILEKYGDFLMGLVDHQFYLRVAPTSHKFFNTLDVEVEDEFQIEINDIRNDLLKIESAFRKNGIDPDVFFDYDTIKIALE